MAIDRIEVSEHERVPSRLVVIGIPTLGMVHVQLMYALMALRHPLNTKVHYYSPLGLSTADGRNEVVARALQRNASHVFFVDDDTWPPPDSLTRLMAHGRPIVSGIYYAKTPTPQPLVLHGRYAGVSTNWTPGDLVECYAHGMGCTLIEARVFTDLAQAGAVEQTEAPCWACKGAGCDGCFGTGKQHRWFYTTDQTILGPDQMPLMVHQTEDVYFLERAAERGFVPTVDTGVFAWHYDHVTGRVFPLKQYEEYRTKGTVTWETEGGTVTWPGVQPA